MFHRIEISLQKNQIDPRATKLKQALAADYPNITQIQTSDIYSFEHPSLQTKEVQKIAQDLFYDPVLHDIFVNQSMTNAESFEWFVEVSFRPGVTDNVAHVACENLNLVLKQSPIQKNQIKSSIAYFFNGELTKKDIENISKQYLMNPLIQTISIIHVSEWEEKKKELYHLNQPKVHEQVEVNTFDCSTANEVMHLSETRLLALSPEEATAISAWFQNPEIQKNRKKIGLHKVTDVELEVIAQTWSEHCKHKIFNAEIYYINEKGETTILHSLYKTYIQGATKKIREQLGEDDWCLSVFKDNAGVIRFNQDWNFVFKVETHNSPSALDPYGGALTGIVGVNRDPFGTGMGSKLIFNTDIFCFGPPNYNQSLPEKLMHPARIFEGVRLGVEHGGNQSGIPTINGSIFFDDCYIGKPLVFCGTGAIMPSDYHGKPAYEKEAKCGDYIVMCGGRIGLDGIHGATFSSAALDENSPVSAVQIGDPITQKRMFDFLWEARNQDLYTCITDNGAGGLSSSVGEMAQFTNGCKIHLDKGPLKYKGLHPWEIFISEAQERMTLAVSPKKIDSFLNLSKEYEVESTVLGEFTNSGNLEAFYEGKLVAKLDMEFLHEGVPTMKIPAKWNPPLFKEPVFEVPQDLGETLKTLLSSYNICSKETIIRQYDHEVQGMSVLKPLVGLHNDGPGDAAVVRPLLESYEGLIVGNGICPRYSQIDTYHMVACAIDEAIRNVISVGGSLEQMAGLDNFCWPDPVLSKNNPDGEYKAAQLVRANQALYDYTTYFGVPCISGKDSMKNDAILDGKKISIHPTLLFSTVSKISDIRQCISMDVKQSNDLIYILGETFDELGGSEYYHMQGFIGSNVPKVNQKTAKLRYQKVTKAIQNRWIQSCHDCSEGGLAVSLAEKAFAGGLGMQIEIHELTKNNLRYDTVLFSETPSRLIVTIAPKHKIEFEKHMQGTYFKLLGNVTSTKSLKITDLNTVLISENIDQLKYSWQKPLKK